MDILTKDEVNSIRVAALLVHSPGIMEKAILRFCDSHERLRMESESSQRLLRMYATYGQAVLEGPTSERDME